MYTYLYTYIPLKNNLNEKPGKSFCCIEGFECKLKFHLNKCLQFEFKNEIRNNYEHIRYVSHYF